MAKPRDHADALRRWLAGERVEIGPVLRTLPADVDTGLAVAAVLHMLQASRFGFGRGCQRLPPAVIRGVLDSTVEGAEHTFLRLATVTDAGDAALVASWQRALQALLDLDLTYAWGSKQRRERFRSLAADPHLLAAIQGTVANTSDVRLDLLAVLVADGSAASLDALIPHLDAALVGRDARLDRLTALRTHAVHTPALDALFAEIEDTLEARQAASPALALGPVIGVGAVEPLWFRASICSHEALHGAPRVQAHVNVDSREAAWFSVSVSVRRTMADFDHVWFDATEVRGELRGLGRCAPDELPRWLADVAARVQATFAEPRVSTGLRGKKRARIASWLAGR